MKTKIVTVALVAAAAVGALSSCSADNSGNSAATTNQASAVAATNAETSEAPATSQAPATVAPATSEVTVSQQQAIDSAQSYLDMGEGFSRAGLIEQLTSKAGDGFAMADAVYAVDHIAPDWNKQAVESAKSYMQMGGFSRASLIEQLSSAAGEQFTVAQATYAADQVGLSTAAAPATAAAGTAGVTVAQQQAIQSAKSYLDMGEGFSRAGLLEQLTSKEGEGFSMADAEFAIDHITVDWNKQAVESAKSYMQMGGFSRASLIEQLSSPAGEQFTVAQATYAADQVGL